jgi:hypothetical protein
MGTREPKLVDADWMAFEPWRIQPVRHQLAGHPLLALGSLAELGRRLEARRSVRTHSSTAEAGTPFNHAPQLHPNERSAAETLIGIGDARAWMSLLNVQTDSQYRTLVDEVLDDVGPAVERRDPGMCYRAGWIFVSSPGAVTPFHMDVEHNFILQILGRKTLYVWDPDDTEVVSELARNRFHALHERDLIQWNESFRQRARVFQLEPGMGAYMPSTSPHMVENGDEPSITASFTYYTASTRRNRLLHRAHHRLRDIGLAPPPVGRHAWLDAPMHATLRTLIDARNAVRRLLGRQTSRDDVRHARTT